MILDTIHRTPYEARVARRRALALAGVILAGYIVVSMLDQRLYHMLRVDTWKKLEGKDWAQFLRTVGYLPAWLALAGVFALLPRPARPPGPRTPPRVSAAVQARQVPTPRAMGVMSVIAGGIAGAACEVIKGVLRRHRPSLVNDGTYAYDWVQGAVPGRGLGLASSHVGMAFGAVFIITLAYPRTAYVLVPLTIGCTLTRLWSGAHFVTDVYVAIALAWYSAWLVWCAWKRNA
jgi:membrane-associated phospholipid phosphatase